MPLCVSVLVSQLNGFFNLLSGVGVSPPLATQNTTATIPLSTLGRQQRVRACIVVFVRRSVRAPKLTERQVTLSRLRDEKLIYSAGT